MSDEKQETKDDILAELRKQSNEEHALATKLRSGDCDDVDYACASCYDEDAKYLSQIADRLEAAAKREKAQVGNAAACREALDDIVGIAKIALSVNCVENSNNSELWNIIDKAKAALSAPPRQCDIGDVDEQERRYRASTDDAYHTLTLTNVLKWTQMPYAEGAGEGKGQQGDEK